jgi:hypothetical protein
VPTRSSKFSIGSKPGPKFSKGGGSCGFAGRFEERKELGPSSTFWPMTASPFVKLRVLAPSVASTAVTVTPMGATSGRGATAFWKRTTRPTAMPGCTGTLFVAGTKSGSPSSAHVQPALVPRGSLKKSPSVAKRA